MLRKAKSEVDASMQCTQEAFLPTPFCGHTPTGKGGVQMRDECTERDV